MTETLDRLGARRRIAAVLAPWRDRPGVTLGVVQDGSLVLHESAGLASVELGVPIGPETCFRIASVSKQFTCAAILMLAAEGRLKVTDPIT
jgi:D-aminopeptidase